MATRVHKVGVSFGYHESAFDGESHGPSGLVRTKRVHEVGAMNGDRIDTHAQHAVDLATRLALRADRARQIRVDRMCPKPAAFRSRVERLLDRPYPSR